MRYCLACECGDIVEVASSDAGSRVPCRCGNEIAIPSLSDLRRGVGEPAYGNAIQAIEAALQDGRLPQAGACPHCGAPAGEVLVPILRCSMPEPPPDPISYLRAVVFLFRPVAALVYVLYDRIQKRKAPPLPPDPVLAAPIRVCSRCRKALKRHWSRPKLYRALQSVRAYERLFNEYQGSEIIGFGEAMSHWQAKPKPWADWAE